MRKRSGFTLIEMLIVITIIGILTSVILLRLHSFKDRVVNVATSKNISEVTNALGMYYDDKGTYPNASTCSSGFTTNCSLSTIQFALSPYISTLPITSYNIPSWSFGSGYIVAGVNQYGYVGLDKRYILTYHIIDMRDSRRYRVVNMPDGKTWMAENLSYASPGSACYQDIETNCGNGYGRLYSRDDAQTVCPDGWHLPSTDEWAIMLNRIENDYEGLANHNESPSSQMIPYGDIAGTYLKSTLADGGIDAYAFSLLLAGWKSGPSSQYRDIQYGFYRTSQEDAGQGISRVFTTAGGVIHNVYNKSILSSVRCMKNM